MKRAEVVELARKAQMCAPWVEPHPGVVQQLERFAALVEEAERSKCATVCRDIEAPPSCNDIERILWGVAVRKCSREVADRIDT
jgi:hypothetical protein